MRGPSAPLTSYLNPDDAVKSIIARRISGYEPCVGKRIDKCVVMSSRQRFEGTYTYWRGGSTYFAGLVQPPHVANWFCNNAADIDFVNEQEILTRQPFKPGVAVAARISFIGRRTLHPGAYGHVSDTVYLAERIISFHPIIDKNDLFALTCPSLPGPPADHKSPGVVEFKAGKL